MCQTYALFDRDVASTYSILGAGQSFVFDHTDYGGVVCLFPMRLGLVEVDEAAVRVFGLMWCSAPCFLICAVPLEHSHLEYASLRRVSM